MSETLVLGLGNLLLSDEGFGAHAVAQLRDRFAFPDDVELVDGATLGLALLPVLEDAERIIVLDAVNLGAPDGTLVRLSWEDLPRALQIKISPHQETAAEVFALRELRRGRPVDFVLIGVQPRSLDVGLELTPPVQAALDRAIEQVAGLLREWGHPVAERSEVAGGERGPHGTEREPNPDRVPATPESWT